MANITLTVHSPTVIADVRATRLEAYEELGRSFEYHVELTSTDHALVSDDLLGKPLCVQVEAKDAEGATRYFHGIVTALKYVATTSYFSIYHVTLRPWSWLLSKRANCRIFQNLTVVDIIEKVFQDAGAVDYKVDGLSAGYKQRVYCVQYRESDLDFVTRLMEEEGIYYFFTQEEAKHTLKLADSSNAHPQASIASINYDANARSGSGAFAEWRQKTQLLTAKYRLQDYNFLTPETNLTSAGILSRSHSHADNEIYDYPGLYQVVADGQTFATIRAQQQQAPYDVSEGSGSVASLIAGDAFTLVGHARDSMNREYIAQRLHYVFDVGSDVGGGGNTLEHDVHCQVFAVPKSSAFRLSSITPKPRIAGPQTAMVVGPNGQEICTDEHGRVKLKFHWDQTQPKDDTVSCWVRVAQYWAGVEWGSIHIPRIGQEVVVEFLEGDPDRPLVTGRVYNASLMPPYKLSDNATQSGIKTRSTPDGNPETYNELRFEDKKGSEHIYFHAEKDFQRVVENNDSVKVGFDKKDKGNQTIEIFNDQTITIGDSEAETGHRTTTLVIGNEKFDIKKGTRTVTLHEGADTHQLKKGDRTVLVDKGNDTHTIGEGNREVTISQGNDTLTVTQGDQTIKVTAGKITMEAGTSIELKVGSNTLKIEQSGITISAAKVSVSATGEVALDGTAGAKLTSSAVVTVQGSLVKIN